MSSPSFGKLISAVLLTASFALAADAVPKPGTEAPLFTLPSQDGSPVALRNLRGKWVVLYFYPKDGTTGCTLEAHNFQRDIAAYEARNTMVVGVSVDTTGSHKEFCAQQGLTFKLLADTEKKVSAQYGSITNLLVTKIAARNTFLIDPQGKVAKVWTGVSPAKHSAEVLDSLERARKEIGSSPGVGFAVVIESAVAADVARVVQIVELCKGQMKSSGIDQWDEVYPTAADVVEDFEGSSLFVARLRGECVGAVCLNDCQAAEYAGMNWRDSAGRAMVIHRLCVDPAYQRGGVAAALMDFAEAFAARSGYSSIRLDTYVGNPKALALYDRRGYHRTGQVRFPRRRFAFDCFEKAVDGLDGVKRL